MESAGAVTWGAGALYACNLGVGWAASKGRRFGVWHHVLYAVVFIAAIGAFWVDRDPALLVVLVALTGMPLTDPRRPRHRWLALLGGLGYPLCALTPPWG